MHSCSILALYSVALWRIFMNTKPFISIRIKVLILLSFCIMIPFIFYWFFSYQYIRTSLDEEFVSQSTDSLTSSGNSISDYLRWQIIPPEACTLIRKLWIFYPARKTLFLIISFCRRNPEFLILCKCFIPVFRNPLKFIFLPIT